MADETVDKLNVEIEADSSGYAAGLDAAQAETDSFIGKVSGAFDGLGGVLMGVGAVAGGALLGIGAASWDMASQSRDAFNELQAQLDLSADEATDLRDISLEVFGNNFGDNLEDANQGLIEVRRQMRGLATEDLESATESAFALRDVFGVDIAESTNAANTLMQEFGLSSEDAFNFITAGFQKGLNNSDDFLDTIGEYSVQFADGGASAGEFFSLMESGFKGGMLGTDKAADAFKEFRVRIQDGSKSTSDALQGLGIDTEDLFAKMATGQVSASDAFQLVTGKLSELDDENLKMQLGVALLGSQFEDLGQTGALSLSMVGTNLDDMAGATDSLNAKYNSLGSMFGGVWRMVQTDILLPIGETLLELANTILPYVQSGIETLGAILSGDLSLGDFVAGLVGSIEGAGPGVVAGLQSLAQAMLSWVGDNLPGWIEALAGFAEAAINWVLDALPGAISALGDLGRSMATWVLDQLPIWGEQLGQLGAKLIQWVVDALPGLGTKLGEVGAAILGAVGRWLVDVAPKLLDLAGKFLSWVWNDVLPALPGLLGDILTAILGFFTNLFAEITPKLLELATKFYSWITDEVLPALPGKLEEIWTSISGWVGDVATNAWEATKAIGKALIDGIVAGIKAMGNAIYDALVGPLEDAWNGAKDFFGINSPSRLMRDTIGLPLMQGITQGIEMGSSGVQAGMQSLLGGLKADATRAGGDLHAAFGAIFSSLQTASQNALGGLINGLAGGLSGGGIAMGPMAALRGSLGGGINLSGLRPSQHLTINTSAQTIHIPSEFAALGGF